MSQGEGNSCCFITLCKPFSKLDYLMHSSGYLVILCYGQKGLLALIIISLHANLI